MHGFLFINANIKYLSWVLIGFWKLNQTFLSIKIFRKLDSQIAMNSLCLTVILNHFSIPEEGESRECCDSVLTSQVHLFRSDEVHSVFVGLVINVFQFGQNVVAFLARITISTWEHAKLNRESFICHAADQNTSKTLWHFKLFKKKLNL